MTPAFGAIAITIVMAYPVNVFPTRYTIDLYFAHWLGDAHRRLRHVGPPQRKPVWLAWMGLSIGTATVG